MSRRKKVKETPVSSYGPDFNPAVVDRKKSPGVYVNGVKMTSNIDDHDKYDARGNSAPTTQQPKMTTVDTPVAKKDDGISSFFKNVFGGAAPAKSKTSTPTLAQTQAGTGIGNIGVKMIPDANNTVRAIYGSIFGNKQPQQGDVAAKTTSAIPQTNSVLKSTKEGIGFGVAPSQSEPTKAQNDAAKLAEYMALENQTDFAQNTEAGDGNLSRTYLGPRYRYINDLQGVREGVNRTGGNGFDLVVNALSGPDVALARQGMGQVYANQYRLYDQMTQDEIDILNYMVATRGERDAEQYLKLLEPTLTGRQAAEEEDLSKTLSDAPVIGSIASVPLNAASAMEGGITMLAGLGGMDLSQNDSFRGATRIASDIRNNITGQMTPAGSFFYQTGMSMLDTAFRLPFGGGGLAIAGLSSAAQTAQQSIESGASTEQTLLLAGISGTLEVATEKLSLDNLIHASAAGTLPGIIKAALTQGGIEASEETASALGNLAADILIRKGDSAWNREVASYMRAGLSREEADKKTLISQTKQVASQTLGGFVSGLFFGSGGQIVNAFEIGQQQGAKGVKAVGKGMQTVAGYDAAVAAYKQAMKSTPRYTAEERISIARDLEASGLSSANKDGIAKMIDKFAMQPDGWLTERGQELTEQAIQVTRQAAEKGYVAEAQLQAKQTRALERLNTMFSDIQASYKASEDALKRGDLAAHTKTVEATTAAIAKYQSAYNTEQADLKAQKIQRESEQRAAAESISSASRKLQAQLPAEMEHHAQLAEQIAAQASPAEANDSPVAQPQAAPMESMPAAETTTQAAAPAVQAASTTQSAPDEVMTAIDDLRGVASGASYRSTLEKHGLSGLMLSGSRDASGALIRSDNDQSILEFVYQSASAQDGFADGWIIHSYNDAKTSELDSWSRFYDVSNVDPNSGAPVQIIRPARMTNRPTSADVSQTNNFFTLVEKGIMSNTGLTAQPVTGNVSATGKTAQAKPAGMFNLASSVMQKASGVPVYKQQSTTTRGNPDVNIMKYVLNGGKPNGEQGKNAVLAGQTISGLQQSGTGNGSGDISSQRTDAQASGRNFGSAGRDGSNRADARGGQVSTGAVWNEVNRKDLTQAENDLNEELTRAGIAPLEDGDLVPVETLDQESAYWLNRMESLSGRKALIYTSKSGRTDIKLGFANNGREHVRYQPGRIMAFHFAHEIAENSSRIRAAGDKVLKSIGDDSFKNYLRIKGAEGANAETQKALRKEFICDAYGAVMFNAISDAWVNTQLGISDEDFKEFVNAFADHLAAPAISEEALDKETRTNLRGSAYSSTDVVDSKPNALDDAYLDALRTGDMKRAQLLVDEAAEEAGFMPLYHGTTKDGYAKIIQSGKLKAKGEYAVYLSTSTDLDGYGDGTLIRLAVQSDRVEIDDEFPSGRIDYRAETDKTRSVQVKSMDAVTRNDAGEVIPLSKRFDIKNPDIRFSSTAIADPQNDSYAAEALALYRDGVTYESYMNRPDADWRVGKQLNGMWNGLRKIRVMQRALDLFENKVTPAQYWEQNKTHWGKEGDQDTQVLSQLYGMYLRNDIPMGGRLGEGEGGQLETLLKDIGSARQFHQMTLTGKSPARLFEDLPSYRKGNTLPNQMKNYRDGEIMRETYFDYLMKNNASRAAYMKSWHDKVQEAFKGGSVRESNLAQLLGEKIVDKENLKQAIYDGNHMLVRAIDGWFVFEHSGKLLAFCDGETTFYRDPQADQKRKAANKASEVDKTESQKARERLKEKFTQVDKSVIRVDRKGNNAAIYIPGIRNPVQIHNGKAPNAQIAIRTADALTAYYAQAWQDQSGVLVENGYAPAKFIPDYFPHLWQEESGLNGVIEAFVGYEPPTQIAGLTGGFKPGKPWAAHLQERTGPLTEFDAIRGFNQYVQKAGDVIFMTPAVQRLRQLESYLRVNAGEKFDATAHSTFVEWLRKYTNAIANKKAELDRSAESLFGHEAFSISRVATTLISRSAVQGSLSSALSQTISYIAALPTLNAKSAVKGTGQAITQSMLAMFKNKHYDKFEEKVPFLQARFGAYEEILTKGIQKADRWVDTRLSWLFTAMDRFATEAVARAKFDELRSKGRTEEEAGRETSAYCVKLFADRSKGMAPVLMNNKVLKPFLQFQLEVENQMHHFRDIKRQSTAEAYNLLTNPQMADKRARQGITEDMVKQMLGDDPLSLEATKLQRKIVASGNSKKWIRMLMYLVFLSLWGEFTRAAMGRDQTWNPYGMGKDLVQDWKSDGAPAALVNLGANVIEQLPYASFATGGRVPIGTGVDKLATVAQDVYEGINEGDWKGLGRHALMAGAALIPSGGQLRKFGTGIESKAKQGYYTDNGELRYPVTEKDYVKAILFGPSAAAPEGYDWNDKLSPTNTGVYQSMLEAGYDPMAAYEMLKRTGTTNAEKGLAILTTDGDGDGKPDFQGKDVNIIAKMLGIKYDSTKDGSFKDWTKAAAQEYIEGAQKDGATPAQQKKIDDIQRMMQLMLGMK